MVGLGQGVGCLSPQEGSWHQEGVWRSGDSKHPDLPGVCPHMGPESPVLGRPGLRNVGQTGQTGPGQTMVVGSDPDPAPLRRCSLRRPPGSAWPE